MAPSAGGIVVRYRPRKSHESLPNHRPQPVGHWPEVNRAFEDLAGSEAAARPNYLWGLLHTARIARTLRFEQFAALELGVAGGSGLIAMEAAADAASARFGVDIAVHGFDTGSGMPASTDWRDAPYVMEAGDYPMAEAPLRARLRRATLHLGPVGDTLRAFVDTSPPPVGFVAVDLDYYTSTVDALSLFTADTPRLFPRVLCYFDDTLGYPWGDSNGERLAVAEFNVVNRQRKIDLLRGMRWLLPRSEFEARWAEALYLVHVTDHPQYRDDEQTAYSRRLDLEG